jgi:hypothetical protein
MAKKIKSLDEMRPNVFESIKRAYVKMGIVRRPQPIDRSVAEPAKLGKQQKSDPPKPQKAGTHKTPLETETKADKENLKGTASKNPKNEKTLHEVVSNVSDVLFEASTVFPFTLVPDTIKLDREKLTVANRYFWKTANITSTPVSEIMSCEANVGPIFGSVHLTFRFFADNQRSIKFFWREDATKFQRIMHGYIIANRKEIDVSDIPTSELKELLDKLGTGASD